MVVVFAFGERDFDLFAPVTTSTWTWRGVSAGRCPVGALEGPAARMSSREGKIGEVPLDSWVVDAAKGWKLSIAAGGGLEEMLWVGLRIPASMVEDVFA